MVIRRVRARLRCRLLCAATSTCPFRADGARRRAKARSSSIVLRCSIRWHPQPLPLHLLVQQQVVLAALALAQAQAQDSFTRVSSVLAAAKLASSSGAAAPQNSRSGCVSRSRWGVDRLRKRSRTWKLQLRRQLTILTGRLQLRIPLTRTVLRSLWMSRHHTAAVPSPAAPFLWLCEISALTCRRCRCRPCGQTLLLQLPHPLLPLLARSLVFSPWLLRCRRDSCLVIAHSSPPQCHRLHLQRSPVLTLSSTVLPRLQL